jgi:alkanesulfonate monooxygenase SsuD/methylene tetrahydromethanopterin reductase-like flavin-dependent oxidoreductase (luciferase family)
MNVGLLQGAHCPAGVEPKQRYLEIIEEAVAAEEAGFAYYGVPEQHFNPGGGAATNIPASSVILGAVATRTNRMRLAWLSAVLPVHHPLQVAETAATLDILSEGRFELSTARSNDLPTLRAFGIDPSETRERWSEALEVIVAALSDPEVEHHGTYWDFPAVPLNPRPVQEPHPPLFYASTSVDGHRSAGKNGLGVIGGNSLPGGWDYVADCARTYKAALADAEPIGRFVTDSLSSFVFAANCAPSQEQAEREAAETVQSILAMVTRMFTRLAKESSGYEYMDGIRAIEEHKHDLRWLIDRAPYISLGTPEFFVERLERLEDLGFDRVALRVDGLPHDVCMRSIELLGEHVLPRFAGAAAAAGGA